MVTKLQTMLNIKPLIHVKNHHENPIPLKAIVVANHPYLSPSDWLAPEDIDTHWGENEFKYTSLHIPIIRTRIFESILGTQNDWKILMKPIGFRLLHENMLRCIHLPSTNRFNFFKNSLLYNFNKIVIFPEGGKNTGKIHSSFARLALELNLAVVYVQLPPIISLYGDINQRGAVLKYIHQPQKEDTIDTLIKIFYQKLSLI
jgi:hypothetical protein